MLVPIKGEEVRELMSMDEMGSLVNTREPWLGRYKKYFVHWLNCMTASKILFMRPYISSAHGTLDLASDNRA